MEDLGKHGSRSNARFGSGGVRERGDGNAHQHADGTGDGVRNSDTDPNGDGRDGGDTNANGNTDGGDTNANGNAASYSDPNAWCNTNGDGDAWHDSDTHPVRP